MAESDPGVGRQGFSAGCVRVHGCAWVCAHVHMCAACCMSRTGVCARVCPHVCGGVYLCAGMWCACVCACMGHAQSVCAQIHGSECVLVHSGTLACSHVCVHVGAYVWWKKWQMKGISDLGTFHQGLIPENRGPIFTALAL